MRTGIDCFAGIGGFSLAMQRCGVQPKVQIEIDEFCQRVLKKNFPKAKRFRDICTVSNGDLRRYRPWILCGGFPCQDVSCAGKGKGTAEGERSGLWREMWRLIRTTRPTWLLIENVPALRTRGSDSVLVALEALGYTTWALVVGAIHVGAPHQRQRVWIVAHAESDIRGTSWNHKYNTPDWASLVGYTESEQCGSRRPKSEGQQRQTSTASASDVEHSEGIGDGPQSLPSRSQPKKSKPAESNLLPNTNSDTIRQQPGRRRGEEGTEEGITRAGRGMEHATKPRLQGSGQGLFAFPAPRGCEQYDWEYPRAVESGLGRTIDGLPGRLDNHRIKALGNAIVPQVAEAIIRAIIAVESVAQLP